MSHHVLIHRTAVRKRNTLITTFRAALLAGLGASLLLAQANQSKTPQTTQAATPPVDSQTAFLQDAPPNTNITGSSQNLPQATPNCSTAPAENLINIEDGSITTENAPRLIKTLLCGSPDYAALNFSGLFSDGKINNAAFQSATFVINVIVWGQQPSQAAGADAAATVSPDSRWYVYHAGRLSLQKKLRGVHRFWFIYVHLNLQGGGYTVRYDFTSTKATPIPIQHLYALASLLTTSSSDANKAAPGNAKWGGRQIDFSYNTSDITISSKAIAPDSQTDTTKVFQTGALDTPQTFHNENPSWWDISLGFPVTNVNQLTFNSTTSGLVPTQTGTKNLLGLADLYPWRKQRYQIADQNYSLIPSFILGLPLAGQPLHKPLFALGWGPPLVQIFAGASIVKQPDVPAGSTATKSVCTGWCPEFSFGINFGVKALASKVSSSSGGGQ